MRISHALILIAAFLVPVVHADLLECVDPVVREVLIDHGGTRKTRFVNDIPSGFPEFNLPDGFALIGSSDSRNNLTVAVKTRLPELSAMEALVEVFTASGFRHNQQSGEPVRGGFRDSVQTVQVLSTTMCAPDDRSMLYLTASRPNDTTYVNLSAQEARQTACSQMQRYMSRGPFQYLPDLVLPADVSNIRQPTSSGSNNTFTMEVLFTSARNASQLVGLFGEQLTNQAWQHNGDWVSQIGQGSAWSMRQGRVRLSGNLRIIPRSESEYLAVFVVWKLEN